MVGSRLMHLPDFAAIWAEGNLSLVDIDGKTLLRLTKFPNSEPHWGKNVKYRFDDPAATFGVTYAAQKLEVAFAESAFCMNRAATETTDGSSSRRALMRDILLTSLGRMEYY